MNDKEKYVSRVCQTTLYLWELFEERKIHGADTQVIDELMPKAKGKACQLRKFVLEELFEKQHLSFTEAAVHLAKWLESLDDTLEKTLVIETSLRAECAPYEREMRGITDKKEVIERSYIRLARYYRLMSNEDPSAGIESRAPEYFIDHKQLPHGKSHKLPCNPKKGDFHEEHVVPCAAIREYCRSYFYNGRSIDEVAKLIQKLLAIVEITKLEKIKLDEGSPNLQYKMPSGWNPESGCIFERLHVNEIKFDAPPGFACAH